jgi:hypothetical protein
LVTVQYGNLCSIELLIEFLDKVKDELTVTIIVYRSRCDDIVLTIDEVKQEDVGLFIEFL